jgi:hypothetical protein
MSNSLDDGLYNEAFPGPIALTDRTFGYGKGTDQKAKNKMMCQESPSFRLHKREDSKGQSKKDVEEATASNDFTHGQH